jgi:hypothetical protein
MWPTLVVVLGTVAVVAVVLLSVADRTDVPLADLAGDSSASPAGATASPSPSPPDGSGDGASGAPTAVVTPVAGQARVDVFNQSAVEGLAARAAEALSTVGWTTGQVDNATLGSPSTTLYIPSGLDAEAAVLLDGFPSVTRTRPAFEGLAIDALTLVVADPDGVAVVEGMEQTATGGGPIASPSAP